jgi:hypothetical protein
MATSLALIQFARRQRERCRRIRAFAKTATAKTSAQSARDAQLGSLEALLKQFGEQNAPAAAPAI